MLPDWMNYKLQMRGLITPANHETGYFKLNARDSNYANFKIYIYLWTMFVPNILFNDYCLFSGVLLTCLFFLLCIMKTLGSIYFPFFLLNFALPDLKDRNSAAEP